MATSILPVSTLNLLLLLATFLLGSVAAANNEYVTGTINGKEYLVRDDRQPSLYTKDFGSCIGGRNITVNRFDAAYYKDNMTVLFDLGGETSLLNETIMMYIGVYAYGESRFDLIFDPCKANIASACPIQAGIPIEAGGVIPISTKDISGIPPLALQIPDFEGQAILRIFSNSTQSEIGCFAAVLTNGNSLAQQEWVSSVLGVFTFIALISSFATAIYGENVSEIRKHYAHSVSVSVVFSVWQHIYYSGAVSMNWPSILVAFWSNYAWSGGMIYSEMMQSAIDRFIGSNKGETIALGAAGTGVANLDLEGGFDIHRIYPQDVLPTTPIPGPSRRNEYNSVVRQLENSIARRESSESTKNSSWYGSPVGSGVPLPGNYSGFPGTLAQDRIASSNAFMTGFLWFLILLAIVATSVVGFKFLLEGLSFTKMMKRDRLSFFRAHFLAYTALAVLRTLYISFFAITFLSLFQFVYLASPGPVSVACIAFLMMLFVVGGLAGYACFYRVRFGDYITEPDRIQVVKCKVLKVVPCYTFERSSKFPRSEDKVYAVSLPWWRVRPVAAEKLVHDDEIFTKKFGWLFSRFRRTRWWFFVVWLVYEFVRSCFLAGAAGHPMIQVFGLLAVECIAFVGIIALRPFEGHRLNVLVVYLLGFSKITTLALSAALATHFDLPRIPATVVAIVIIVIQGLLTIATLILIVIGAVTSYMSIMRNRETMHPARWIPARKKYLNDLDFKVKDIPRPQSKTTRVAATQLPKEPQFKVWSMHRMAKIEDEDKEFQDEINGAMDSHISLPRDATGTPRFGAPSIRSTTSYSSIPRGAKVLRASWSSADFRDSYSSGSVRQKTGRSRSLAGTRDFEQMSRPVSRTPPPLNYRLNKDIVRHPSPFDLRGDPFSTPVSSSVTGHCSSGPTSSGRGTPIPRPKSWQSSRSSNATRLSTIRSVEDEESEVPPMPKIS